LRIATATLALDGRLIGRFDLVEVIADLVRPAQLDGDAGEDLERGYQQAGTPSTQIMSSPFPVSPRR
jgi:hypothetical protein